jgi:hypothetical protein
MAVPEIDLQWCGLDKTPRAEIFRLLASLGAPIGPDMSKEEMLGRLIRWLQPRVTKRQLLLDELASLVKIKDTLERRACEIIRELAKMGIAKNVETEEFNRAAA